MKVKNDLQMKIKFSSLLFLGGILLLNGCVTTPYSRPDVQTNDIFRDLNPSDTTTLADLDWKKVFPDLALQNLIETGLRNNLDLKIAVERIAATQAYFKASELAFLPNLQADLNRTTNKLSERAVNFPPGTVRLKTTTNRLQLSTSWEADIWGKLKSAKKMAYANLLQSEAGKRAIQTQLVANIANGYYTLLALDEQLQITESTLANRREQVETMKALKEAGYVTKADVMQSEAGMYAVEVSIPDIKKRIRETENAINFQLALPSTAIARSKIENQIVPTVLDTGVPAQLLKNRPDVQAAELGLVSAFENVNVAKTYFYPALTLTANGGLSSFQLSNFFNNSIFYSLISGLTQPIFNRGLNKSRLAAAQASQKEAALNFQKTILIGGQEVSNALYAYQNAVDKARIRKNQINSLTTTVSVTKELLINSPNVNYTDVLNSEQNLILAEINGVNDRLEQLQAVVNLYQALGGGWEK